MMMMGNFESSLALEFIYNITIITTMYISHRSMFGYSTVLLREDNTKHKERQTQLFLSGTMLFVNLRHYYTNHLLRFSQL